MVFASVIFIFIFLPALLVVHFAAPKRVRNGVLLLASLVFYAWGEPWFVLLMVGSIVMNFLFGLVLHRTRTGRGSRLYLGLSVAGNIGCLATFKYANFLVDNANLVFARIHLPQVQLGEIHLPIGISFFTFQALSYVIDVYSNQAAVQRNPIRLALYIALFPQLIAGPIVRYHDIAAQLAKRVITRPGFAYGVRRFVVGLGKKVLIANIVAKGADQVFAIPVSGLTPGLAWFGAICYTAQIYFDFSGYSDMAIGLGRMFGFQFRENFNYPYISGSIREFWRRWHISLSTWFRDYLYIPLGGSRRSTRRVYANLVTVFFLCGLWHGASWTFALWGMYHGLFLVAERLGLEKALRSAWRPLRHVYALLVVIVGWVVFRSETFPQALGMLAAMSGFAAGDGVVYHVSLLASRDVVMALALGAVASLPIVPALGRWRREVLSAHPARPYRALDAALGYATSMALIVVLVLSAAWLSGGTYNPFIYFRF